jgi:hypothetical protein
MRIIYTPQRADITCAVVIDGEILTIAVNGQSDTFDFTGTPDGKTARFNSTLPMNPLRSAERTNGELVVTLLHWYGPEPQYEAPLYLPPDDPEALAAYELSYADEVTEAEAVHTAAKAAWELETQVREVTV